MPELPASEQTGYQALTAYVHSHPEFAVALAQRALTALWCDRDEILGADEDFGRGSDYIDSVNEIITEEPELQTLIKKLQEEKEERDDE